MSTPAQGISEIWQMTPVIIKTGGGPVDPGNQIKCTIGAKSEDFISTLVDDKWQSAMSAQTASIFRVVIDDNGSVTTIKADLTGLAVVQITYGQDTLIVQEVALPDSELTNLSISSSVQFTAHVKLPDEWSHSHADVSPDPPFIVFTQGSRMKKIPCTSTAVTVTIGVDWGGDD